MYNVFIRKRAILKHIQSNTNYIKDKEVIKLEGIDYYILKKFEGKEEKYMTGKVTDLYHLLYKDNELYTVIISRWNNEGEIVDSLGPSNDELNIPEIFSYNSRDKYIKLFNDLYNDVKPTILGFNERLFGRSYNKVAPSPSSGGKKASTAYKSTGDKVRLFIDNKKLHRSIYVKGNGKAKYCKINNEFVLLSKLKNKVIE